MVYEKVSLFWRQYSFPYFCEKSHIYTFCCLTTLKRNVRFFFFLPDFGTSKGRFYGGGCLVMR